MSSTLSLEGVVTANNTRTELTAQGSVATPSTVVPAGFTKIDKVYASAAANFAAAGSASILVRIGGNAVKAGEQTLVIGGAGGPLPQLGSDTNGSRTWLFRLENADIPISASDTISVFGEMMGSDLGEITVGVTLVFA